MSEDINIKKLVDDLTQMNECIESNVISRAIKKLDQMHYALRCILTTEEAEGLTEDEALGEIYATCREHVENYLEDI